MSQTEMFKKLGAPLRNTRQSWGAVREADQTVFLRVWQDGTKKHGEERLIWLGDMDGTDESYGARERLEHIELIRSGYGAYLVMCQAEDRSATPRTVRSYNAREVFVGGEVVEMEGSYWIGFGKRVDVRTAMA